MLSERSSTGRLSDQYCCVAPPLGECFSKERKRRGEGCLHFDAEALGRELATIQNSFTFAEQRKH